MSYPSTVRCINCEASGKKCDGTRAPAGCRRCVQVGVKCRGYQIRTARSKHVIRENEHQTSPDYRVSSEFAIVHPNPNELNNVGFTSAPDNSSAQDNTLLSAENVLADPCAQSNSCATRELQPYTTSHQQTQIYQRQNTTSAKHILDPNPWTDHALALRANFTSPLVGFGQFSALSGQEFNPPTDSRTWPCASASYHGAIPRATPERLEHSISQKVNMQQSQRPMQEPMTMKGPANDWLVSSEDDDEIDLLEEYREVLTTTLAPDRKVKSNAFPFFIQSSALWIKLFIFEPARLTTVMRGAVIQKRTSDEAAHERVFLLALTLSTLSSSTKYDLADFMRFQTYASARVRAARAVLQEGQLTREGAVEAMDTCHAVCL
ncbi:hypothetical protein RSOLAG1IB_09963 [Rhizoctonia solani AG-1 IB]|uniref:Zn(2)-C6 fungal-type domain-containing protein n=1 Tax=Thanatephorus cucumeris (strain AG1-IB / isolate 7/3/14) TaxID=1108050 RepID=A0A0B7FUG7_THACB|nr:hypothetical protein RSOLAG1IB_09963 [Rhizoctonia solani AG-1 IB]